MRFLILILSLLVTVEAIATIKLIEPDDVFSPNELESILKNNNFFHFKEIDDETPIWVGTYRKYSHHLLGGRTHLYSIEDVVHKVLTDGFPIQYSMEQLFRARAGIHSELGNILPQLSLSVGDVAQLGVSNIFTNVFSFILPSNWLKLANQDLFYEATKLLLVKTVLDEMLTAKEVYLEVHRHIIDYEILNYYYVHLQVFLKKYPQDSREIFTVLGYLGVLGTMIANKRLEIKIGFDVLARVMSLEKIGTTYSADTFNISEIKNFPKHIHELDTHAGFIKDKEEFLKEVVRNSLELKIASEFFKMSKLDVGIIAMGGTMSVAQDAGVLFRDSRFAVSVGYGTIPNILIAKSLSRTAKLDIQSGYIEMLTVARILLDRYTYAFEKYTEAKQALILNREALKKNLDYFMRTNAIPDGTFILSLSQLISSELNINRILHNLFESKAAIDRYLLKDHVQALKYLPAKGDIVKELENLKKDKIDEIRKEEDVDRVFKKLKHARDLNLALYEHHKHPVLSELTDEQLESAVKNNIGNLLYSKGFFKKRKSFYRILGNYVHEKSIRLTSLEAYVLKKKQASVIDRMFRKKDLFKDDYLYNLDFQNL
jgi:hypothetical protein